MCTLSYLPATDDQPALVVVNRDEQPVRNATRLIRRAAKNGGELWYPAEPVFGGTNVAVHSFGRVFCLLNGAFLPHKYSPPYAKSRGLLLLDFAEATSGSRDPMDLEQYENIEPFLLVSPGRDSIEEFRWDGQSIYNRKYDPAHPHVWASAQMYDLQNRQRRREIFAKALKTKTTPSLNDLMALHEASFREGKGFFTESNGVVQTISITRVALQAHPQIIHRDVMSGAEEKLHLD